MHVANEVHNFTLACERLIAAVESNRPLTDDEFRVVAFYCNEVPVKVAPTKAS